MKGNMLPYLTFVDQTEAALNHYQSIFGREVQMLRMGDRIPDLDDEYKNRIMYASFIAEGVEFFASDCEPGATVEPGTDIALCLCFDDAAEMWPVWDALKEGGSVQVEPGERFWGDYFGQLKDPFGITWYFDAVKQ